MSESIITTTNLSRRFGKVRAVDSLNLDVKVGEIYGFLGRNGAGKTTTIRMIMGAIRPDRGEIHLFGDTHPRTSTSQKRHIGYVSQEQFFYPWMTCKTLGRFVSGFYPTWDKSEFDRLLLILELPPDRKVSELSGGMKVKLALSLALAHRPQLLILDEPTSGLDPVARREFLEMIHQQARSHGRTTFFSSHRIDGVEAVADRIGIIQKGRLEYQGPVETLRESVREVRLPFSQSTEGPSEITGSDEIQPAVDLSGFETIVDAQKDGDRRLILSAPVSTWSQHPFPSTSVRQLSLEDIFIAFSIGKIPEL